MPPSHVSQADRTGGGPQVEAASPFVSDLPFENPPEYRLLKLFARTGAWLAFAAATGCFLLAAYMTALTGYPVAMVIGAGVGLLIGLLLLVLAELVRAVTDIMLPR
ncbi:MAG: hypothetical protein ACT6RL_21250 [Neoaquamicrobium sediminum]